jgi:hypothetical protein
LEGIIESIHEQRRAHGNEIDRASPPHEDSSRDLTSDIGNRDLVPTKFKREGGILDDITEKGDKRKVGTFDSPNIG